MTNSLDYIEVSVRIQPFTQDNAEIVEAEIVDLPFESFVIEDPFLKCYIPRDRYNPQDLKVLLSGLDSMDFTVSFTADLIPPQDWNAAWESTFTPIVVDSQVTIRAPFNEDVPATRFNIVIDPKMAFGTGSHETTWMMIHSMLENDLAIRDKVVLDMGCGTGVLAILAAKLRALHVYAFDIDAVAAQSAYDNARRNRAGRRIETRCGDASLLQMGRYDVILANIHLNILREDIPTYRRSMHRGGMLLVSGFFTEDIPAMRQAAENTGFQYINSLTREGWACLKFIAI